MERLTEKYRNDNGTAISKESLINQRTNGINDYCSRIISKLADYEDLEEQGLLLKLPCKVGDMVYSALGEKVKKSEVLSVKYHCEAENHGVFIRERIIIETDDIVTEINFSDIGKTAFLAQAEAEQKLKEMKP